MDDIHVPSTPIDGLSVIDLEVRDDTERPGATFREVFQAEKFAALGLPAFSPVQWSVSESRRGTLRGIHAEPWDKLVHVVTGEVFAAIADVRRDSPTAGHVWTGVLDARRALHVSRGLGNAFQVTSDAAAYAYLVNEPWRPDVAYPAVAWDDPDLAIDWPITDERLALSSKDRSNPSLRGLWASGG